MKRKTSDVNLDQREKIAKTVNENNVKVLSGSDLNDGEGTTEEITSVQLDNRQTISDGGQKTSLGTEPHRESTKCSSLRKRLLATRCDLRTTILNTCKEMMKSLMNEIDNVFDALINELDNGYYIHESDDFRSNSSTIDSVLKNQLTSDLHANEKKNLVNRSKKVSYSVGQNNQISNLNYRLTKETDYVLWRDKLTTEMKQRDFLHLVDPDITTPHYLTEKAMEWQRSIVRMIILSHLDDHYQSLVQNYKNPADMLVHLDKYCEPSEQMIQFELEKQFNDVQDDLPSDDLKELVVQEEFFQVKINKQKKDTKTVLVTGPNKKGNGERKIKTCYRNGQNDHPRDPCTYKNWKCCGCGEVTSNHISKTCLQKTIRGMTAGNQSERPTPTMPVSTPLRGQGTRSRRGGFQNKKSKPVNLIQAQRISKLRKDVGKSTLISFEKENATELPEDQGAVSFKDKEESKEGKEAGVTIYVTGVGEKKGAEHVIVDG